jgi:hypothetical protein
MSREVCGICWTPYDDSYKCACPTPALERMSCPRCGKVTDSDTIHTCTPKGLPHCENSCEANAFKIEIRRLNGLLERRLTDEVIADLWHKNGTYHHHFARAIERWLKGEK